MNELILHIGFLHNSVCLYVVSTPWGRNFNVNRHYNQRQDITFMGCGQTFDWKCTFCVHVTGRLRQSTVLANADWHHWTRAVWGEAVQFLWLEFDCGETWCQPPSFPARKCPVCEDPIKQTVGEQQGTSQAHLLQWAAAVRAPEVLT